MSTLMEMIDGLIHEADVAALPEWTGIPLGRPVFDYHHPDELEEWFEANYPPALRVDGAPIITLRSTYATRAVLGYSPFGGYDLSAARTEAL